MKNDIEEYLNSFRSLKNISKSVHSMYFLNNILKNCERAIKVSNIRKNISKKSMKKKLIHFGNISGVFLNKNENLIPLSGFILFSHKNGKKKAI